MPRPPRDTQKSRLYRAEMRISVSPLPGLLACEKFGEQVAGSLWWAIRFPHHTVADFPKLRPGNGARSAFFRPAEAEHSEATITLPRKYRSKNVVLHELGHWALLSQPELSYHGPSFARLLLDLVTEFLGTDRAQELQSALAIERVRVAPPAQLGADGYLHYGPDRIPSKKSIDANPAMAIGIG